MVRLRLLLITLVLASGLGSGCAWGPKSSPDLEAAPLLDGLGNHHYPISTEDPLAQRLFDQGLTLAFAFNHQEAARSFRHAARLDPDCAMAYWGVALVLGPNINAPMDAADVPEAVEASERALELADRVTPKERALIEAVAKRYASPPPEDRSSLDQAYADAMRNCARAYPEDDEIATLTAEAIMDLSPWDYWDKRLEPHPATLEILDLLETVLGRTSSHPGANHLYIHAVEYGRPELGIGAAKRLETLAVPIVFDPVMVATSGSVLADESTIAVFERLMARATLVTPNRPELEALSGSKLFDDEDVLEASLALQQKSGCAVLAKGGHAQGEQVVDLLVLDGVISRYYSERLDTRHTHGTGCTLASAIASGLGGGLRLDRAVDRAIQYVHAALLEAPRLGAGAGPVGHALGTTPYHHLKAAESEGEWGVETWDSVWSPEPTKH